MSSRSSINESIGELVSKMSKLGVDVIWDAFILKEFSELPQLCFDQAPEERVLRACQLLLGELEFYGKQILRATHLERIVLCSDLRDQAGTRLEGCRYSKFQDATILDISRAGPMLDSLRHTFHHEFFHLVDYHAEYHHYTEWNDIFEASTEFAPSYNYKPHDYASVYAMTSPVDDKAELYAGLIMNYWQTMAMMPQSKIFAEKVVRLKKLLIQFSPDFDDSFWVRVSTRN